MTSHNLLPYDGRAIYLENACPPQQADRYFQQLQTQIDWRPEELWMFGKHIITRRQVAWYGSKPFAYTYSGSTKVALPWLPVLQEIKEQLEQLSQHTYNCCLLNLYPSGADGMGWHSDDEQELQPNAAIASLSLGAERRFLFRHKSSKEKVALSLQHGSLLLMLDHTQTHWQHSLPKSKRVGEERINLTFRSMGE